MFAQLVKKFSAFIWNEKFIAMLTRDFVLSQLIPTHIVC
jgi:hypothetical protein